jgi:uncharacterized membrane protein
MHNDRPVPAGDDAPPPRSSLSRRIGRHVRSRLISGVFLLVPLAVTIIVLDLIFRTLTAFLRPLLQYLLQDWPDFAVTLLAVMATVLLVYLVGLITAHVIGRRLLQLAEELLLRIPLVKTIYGATRQVMQTFSVGTRGSFEAVVLVEFPQPGSLALAFLTGRSKAADDTELLRVFLPTTPNPTSGYLLLVPASRVTSTSISVEDGIKMVVSGGVLAPDRLA